MKVSQHQLMPHIRDMLNEDKSVTFKVSGNSMWPFYINQKTNVTLKKTNVKKHDVVLAYYDKRYVLHRILNIKDDVIILRGDAAILKEHVNPHDIIGKVVSYENKKPINQHTFLHKLLVILWIYNPLRRLILRIKR